MAYISFQPHDFFNTVLYNGTGSSQSITGVGFRPDWLWQKSRSNSQDGRIFDAVRGGSKLIYPSLNNAESTDAQLITSFDSDGFTMGSSGSNVNDSGTTNVAWNWKANGAGSSNTDGSVTSTVSVSTTSGFSICKFDATGSTMTFGHGLGVKPAVMLIKRTDSNSNGNWIVYHKNVGATKFLTLNDTSAETTASTRFADTEPTSSVATVGSELLSGGTYIAYCFTPVRGFSSMGSYVGNGNASGPFIYTNGMKPAFVMIKNSSATESWYILDTKRPGYNTNNYYLLPNTSGAEGTSTSLATSLLSNGFKIENSDTSMNTSGQTYIYMAFAEEPLVSSNGVPAVAK